MSAVVRETDLLAEAVVAAGLGATGLGTAVPSAPGWDVARLARHVGHAHRWAEAVVRTRGPVAPTAVDDRTPPEDADGVAAWLRDGAARLARTLEHADPDAEVWSWSDEATARFWDRWALHETLLRRVDAELATGGMTALDPALAAEGIDHWLAVLALDDGGVHPLAGTGQTVHLHATDGDGVEVTGEWLLTRAPGGLTWTRGHAKADVAVRGSVGALLLVLLRRAAPSTVEVLGDATVLDGLLADLPL